jgi:crotonobetainyl-CoA:carnitine CoA-transferase CaiB-like acyl-CoA transferase
MDLPLKGLVVLEFSQYLSVPSAGLRLADLGARVIKIEKPGVGDAGRKLAIKNLWVDENSLLFHTINRNKESVVADLKNPEDLAWIKKLVAKADVLVHNFRPGVMEKNGLDHTAAHAINPRLVYAELSGYGKKGPWKNKPGQDLLLQSITGLAFTTGNASNGPVPFGISIADILCGSQLVQGILGALIRRQKTGKGALLEISLLETLLDFQFELLTTYFASGQLPRRTMANNGHPLLSAPYGLYATKDSFIALAMMDIQVLATAIDCAALKRYSSDTAFKEREEIKNILSAHLATQNTAYWIECLHGYNLWAMEVLNWRQMSEEPAYQLLQAEQTIQTKKGAFKTTRCPIRINGKKLFAEKPAPQLGEHTNMIKGELMNGVENGITKTI